MKYFYPREIPTNSLINAFRNFTNKSYIKKPVMLTVPKKKLYLVLAFMGEMSALVKFGLIRSLHKHLPFCKVKIVFKTSNRLNIYFSFKDVVPEPLRFAKFIIFRAEAAMLHTLVKPFGT